MITLVSPAYSSDTSLELTKPVPRGLPIQIGDIRIRVYDCIGTNPCVARLGYGYQDTHGEKYYPIPLGGTFPAGTPITQKEN